MLSLMDITANAIVENRASYNGNKGERDKATIKISFRED